MTWKNVNTDNWPSDTPGSKLRREGQKVKDNFDTLAGGIGGATITVGAENTNVRAITIQLLDHKGNDLAFAGGILCGVFLDAARAAVVATGGSTGIAIGTDGALFTLVAKKLFWLISEPDGDIDLTWTDTGTEAAYLGLQLPNGNWVMSSALTNT